MNLVHTLQQSSIGAAYPANLRFSGHCYAAISGVSGYGKFWCLQSCLSRKKYSGTLEAMGGIAAINSPFYDPLKKA
jgi:hypothetical protein